MTPPTSPVLDLSWLEARLMDAVYASSTSGTRRVAVLWRLWMQLPDDTQERVVREAESLGVSVCVSVGRSG